MKTHKIKAKWIIVIVVCVVVALVTVGFITSYEKTHPTGR